MYLQLWGFSSAVLAFSSGVLGFSSGAFGCIYSSCALGSRAISLALGLFQSVPYSLNRSGALALRSWALAVRSWPLSFVASGLGLSSWTVALRSWAAALRKSSASALICYDAWAWASGLRRIGTSARRNVGATEQRCDGTTREMGGALAPPIEHLVYIYLSIW